MGQIFSSGNDKTSSERERSSYNKSSELFQQRKSESTIPPFRQSKQRSLYDDDWEKQLTQLYYYNPYKQLKVNPSSTQSERRIGVKDNASVFYASTTLVKKTPSTATGTKTSSVVKRNVTYDPYYNCISTTSERKTPSTATGTKTSSVVKGNVTSPYSYYISTTPERKVSAVKNTTSPYHLSTTPNKGTTFGVTSLTASRPSSTSEEDTTSLDEEKREEIKRVTEIVRSILAHGKNYNVIYGNWSCPKWPRFCDNEDEWQSQCTRESLANYLKLSLDDKYDHFTKSCKGCNEKCLVTSFFLYKRQPTCSSKDPDVEIICHLEWNNHYRVFAEWKCLRPQGPKHEWKSSYTWITLRNFIENTPAKVLSSNPKNFYAQKCHECREACEGQEKKENSTETCKDKSKKKKHWGCRKCNHETIILNYSPLIQSSGGKPHKRWLCAKCKGGAICVRTDKNYQVRRIRNIKLFNVPDYKYKYLSYDDYDDYDF